MRARCQSKTLHAYVDGELTDDDRDAFEPHLATCRRCGRDLAQLLALSALLADFSPPPASRSTWCST